VNCLYFSESERVAMLEYRRAFAGTSVANAPKLTFIAEVDLRRIIDLEKTETKSVLDLSAADLSELWRGAALPTRLQQLGGAVSKQRVVSAIRYLSPVVKKRGKLDACRLGGESTLAIRRRCGASSE